MDLKLYEITDEMRAILDDDDWDESLEARLESLSMDLQDKVGNVARYVEHLGDLAAAVKRREQAITERRKALERQAKRLTDYLQRNMEAVGATKITDNRTGTEIAIVKNPPAVEIEDENNLPGDYLEVRTAIHVDRRRILEDLKNGVDVPGARLRRSFRLRIR